MQHIETTQPVFPLHKIVEELSQHLDEKCVFPEKAQEAFIPTFRAINPVSGTNWEGVGVQPDLPVSQEEAFDIAYQRAKAQVG